MLTNLNAGTTQVCAFRDDYTPLTATGFSIYGLSKDSPKANTTFKTKQNLPYPLLCDTSATLISAIGLKKAPNGTTRGVFVIDKSGKILAAEAGSPVGKWFSWLCLLFPEYIKHTMSVCRVFHLI